MNIQNKKTNYKFVLLEIEGMKCGGCVRTVEQTLIDQASVEQASVNLVERTALIELKEEGTNIEDILIALANRGFPSQKRVSTFLEQKTSSEVNALKQWWTQWRQLMIALVLLIFS